MSPQQILDESRSGLDRSNMQKRNAHVKRSAECNGTPRLADSSTVTSVKGNRGSTQGNTHRKSTTTTAMNNSSASTTHQ